MSTASELKTQAVQRKAQAQQRLYKLIDARTQKMNKMQYIQDTYAQDAFADYQQQRKDREEARALQEEMQGNAARDWHDDAMQGASMGMQVAGPWGALIGLGVGTVKGQAEAISTKVNEDGMNFGEAFAGTHFDIVPGFNIGAAAVGQDGLKQSYMHKNMLQHGDDAQFWESMGTLGAGFAKEVRNRQMAKEVAAQEAKADARYAEQMDLRRQMIDQARQPAAPAYQGQPQMQMPPGGFQLQPPSYIQQSPGAPSSRLQGAYNNPTPEQSMGRAAALDVLGGVDWKNF